MTIIGTNFSFLFVLERPGTYTGKFSSNEPVKKIQKTFFMLNDKFRKLLSLCLMTTIFWEISFSLT